MPRGPPLPPKPRTGAGSAAGHGAPSPAVGDDAGRQHLGRGGSDQQQQQQQQQQRGEGGKQPEDDMSLRGLFRMLERRGVPSGQVHVIRF